MTQESTTKAIEAFKKLNLEQQKEKLIIMVKQFVHTAPVWQETLNNLQNNENVNAEYTTTVYGNIMKYGDNIKEEQKQEAMKAMEKANDYMEQMKQKETQEKQKEEEELGSMLDEIENL